MARQHAPSDTSVTNQSREYDDKFGLNVPPLQVYLKKVLNRYPEGGQLLKEQIQNADDAGARRVVFLYDKTQHSTQTMWSDSLHEFNGPSLFVYNDATFTEQDWKNIQNPEQSGKLEDRTKIGRFGLGFISVYHLTDLPSVLSGHQIGFLDPHEKYFAYDPHTHKEFIGKKGKRWRLNGAETLDKFPDQFSPYINPLFNCSRSSFEHGHFEGTIFRFPLRNRRTKSQLSSVVWDDDRVYGLFKSFQADADISLLFLKNIQSVSFYEKTSADEERPKLLFSVEVPTTPGFEGGDLDIQLKRRAFLQAEDPSETVNSCWRMSIKTQAYDHGLQNSDNTSEYLTVNTLKNERLSKELRDLAGDGDLNLLPWVGVSMLLDFDHNRKRNAGRTFCFLPLPDNPQMCTGLPIHVHGYFGLADNRRSIQWPDDESKHDKAAKWNQLLVNEVFPDAYARLIEDAIKNGTSTDVVYSAWPMTSNLNENWETGVKNFLQNIKNKPVLYTSVNGGSWKIPRDVYIDPNKDDLIRRVLEQKGYPVITLPDHVTDALKWGGIQTQVITTRLVRKAIKGDSLDWMSRKEKIHLLKYILADMQFQDLQNIHLLPLADGNFTSFTDTNSAAVYIPTAQIPRDIFPDMADRFAADDIPQSLSEAQDYTQLRCLTYEIIPGLMEKALPRDWVQGSSVVVEWIPGAPGQPEIGWIERFWTWITNQTPKLLFNFRNIPLVQLPMKNGHHQLAKIEKNMLIYYQKVSNFLGHDFSMTESMCSYLKSLGVVVIQDSLPEFIAQHPYTDQIILPPDTNGVAAVLEACWSNDAIENVARFPNGLRKDIRCLFSEGALPDRFKKLLCKLPIFEGADGQYVAVSQCKFVVPEGFYGLPVKRLRRRFLVAKEECDNLAIKLGAARVSKLDLINYVLADIQSTAFYSSNECSAVMGWLLQDLEYDDIVRNFSFVPTTAGHKSPANLFPPDDTHLKNLFKGQPVFPVDEYAHGTLLRCLKRVGLRDLFSVSAQELLEIVISLSESKDKEVATALLEHITDHSSVLSTKVNHKRIEKPLWKFLQDRAWVPCQSIRPNSYPDSVGWSGSGDRLHRPDAVALMDHANLLGSVKPLVKVRQVKEEFRSFGWGEIDPNKYPIVEEVAQHLENIATSYQQDRNVQAVTVIVHEIYAFLNQAPTRHLENIFTSKNARLVWNGNGFTPSHKIAFNNGRICVNLSPYRYILPASLRQYDKIFNALGVHEQFDEESLSEVLQCIHGKHVDMEFEVSVEDQKTDLKLVCDILTNIIAFASPNANIPDVFVPCRELQGMSEHKLKMIKSHECLYVDEDRLLDEYSRGDCKLPVVHEMVPNDIAKRLGLRPLSHSIAPVDNIDLGYDIAGPHQSTVNAIKRNLEMYKEGLDIFKEFIQNADDAGATKVKFLIDWRENTQSRDKLLSDGMEMCHGPALWAYNNATFTEGDVTNICSIAAASKKEHLEKIGRFGLGFTSVYHITDVPSIVSGSFILIFDPRTNHLGTRVNPGQPGIRLDIKKGSHRNTLKSYPNQFQPFQGVFDCDLSPSSSGFDKTLFRLPLRTEREATDTSQDYLSKAIYNSKEEMTKMVMALKKSAASLLLFTQNVTQVSVHTLDANSSPTDKYETLLDISAECVKILPRCIDNQENTFVQRQILKATAERMKNTSNTVPESTCILKVTSASQVTKRTGKKDQRTKDLFVVSSCMTTGSALEMARSIEGRQAGVLPCGGVAVQLKVGMKGLVPISLAQNQQGQPLGSAFSYLPLNVNTGLPFHINANFLLQPNRRHLWSKASSASGVKQGGEFETRWNVGLMEEVLTKAFINLLSDLQILHKEDYLDARRFQTLWPCVFTTESDFHPLVEAFYKQLCSPTSNKAPRLIYNGNRWVSMYDCFFIDESLKQQEVQNSIIAVLNKRLAPKKWVQLEKNILTSIAQAEADTVVSDHTYSLSRFLKEIFFPILSNDEDILIEYRNQIVLHLLDLRIGTEKQNQYDEELRRSECIPVTPNGEELVSPDQVVHPRKPIGKLFSERDGRFPYGDEFRRKERLVSLEELGMAIDDLDWEDVCEVAESFGNDDLSKAVVAEKSSILLKLVDWKLHKLDIPSPAHIKRLQDAPFLPVLDKPPDYPMIWYSSSKSCLMSASGLYEAKYKYLMGSVQPILDEDCLGKDALSERILEFLGIRQKPIPVENVIRQLRFAIDMTQDTVAPSTAHICNCIYDFLNRTLCTTDASLSETNRNEFLDELRSLPFVLVDRRFLRCDQVAFRNQRQSGTYLFTFPQELYGFSNLFKVCGVRETFETRDFMNVLSSLKEKYQNDPLSANDIAVVKDILAALADDPCIDDYRHEIWVPDTTGVLKEIAELAYNDIPWERENEDLTYPHKSVTRHEVEKLGIKTCRQLQLQSCSSGCGFESPFGQTEELTNRLKNILMEYDHIPDVFKELLQNADDAGATEIHFVYDPRKHSADRLVGDSWTSIHTLPALCVYNDKIFSSNDLEGIQKVGVGGKLADVTTTGRFGIGFNATYHLTDCPTFVTNNKHLCVFDPQIKYVPGATREKPGMLYRVDGEDGCNEKFPDMMASYLDDIFELEGSTMFRFPLRSATMARESEISSNSYTDSKMETLLNGFESVARESLLFLNHIKKISISTINKHTGEMALKYVIKATVDREGETMQEELAEHLDTYKDSLVTEIPPLNKVYRMEVEDSAGKKESWLVSQTIGFHTPDIGFDDNNHLKTKTHLPRGGTAALLQIEQPKELTDSSLSNGLSRRKYKAFCFLPLQIYTGLPIHVNGSFVLDLSRRNLVKGAEYHEASSEGFIHKWNRLLLMHVIAPAYAYLIEKAGRVLLDPNVDNFQSSLSYNQRLYDRLFPLDIDGLDKEWQLLAAAALQFTASNKLEVLPVVKNNGGTMAITWHHVLSNTNKAFFDNLEESLPNTDDVSLVRRFLHATDFKLLSSSTEVCNAFQKAGVATAFVSPQSVLHHLGNLGSAARFTFPCMVEESAFETVEVFRAVCEFCLESTENMNDLKGTPLCLTNDGKLNVFTATTAAYVTHYFDVLSNLPQNFIHKDLVYVFQHWINTSDGIKKGAFHSGLLKDFTIYELSANLGAQLQREWQGQHQHIKWTPEMDGHPTEEWIRILWEFILSATGEDGPKECLHVLRDWPIIPTLQKTLVPPSLAHTVLFLDQFTDSDFREEVVQVLRKMGCAEVDMTCMFRKRWSLTFSPPTELLELLNSYLVVPTNQTRVLGVIHFIENSQKKLETEMLSENDSQILLRYFQEGCMKFSVDDICTLKSLSIFVKADGQLTDVSNHKHCHIMSNSHSMPLCEQNAWMQAADCLFLKPLTMLDLLYENLQISNISLEEIYLKYILPNFEVLNIESKLTYIKHIRDEVLHKTQMRKELIFALRKTAFIRDEQGVFRCAKDFFDSKNPVFDAMKDTKRLSHKLLPPPFSEAYKWRKFLPSIGLNWKVKKDLFLEFAREIEHKSLRSLNDEELKNIFHKSEILISQLDKNEDLQDSAFLRSIADIKFIPSVSIEEKLLNIHPACPDNTPFIAYRGSVSDIHKELVWSVAKLLPYWAIPKYEYKIFDKHMQQYKSIKPRECLGIGSAETLDKVLAHTQNICHRMAERNMINEEDDVDPAVRDKFKAIMKQVYEYLQKHLQKYGANIQQRLKHTPICLVDNGHVLLKAEQMVERLPEEVKQKLEPYIYETPRGMEQYDDVFKLLGTTDKITFDQLGNVLAVLKGQCVENIMHTAEVSTAHAAVFLLFDLLYRTHGRCPFSMKKLYLPTPDNHLMLSTELHYADAHDIGEAEMTSTDIKFIVPLKQCGLFMENESKLLELLPEQLRPQSLKRTMPEKPCLSNRECEAEDDCQYLQHVRKMITSEEMQQVLHRLIQRRNKGRPLNNRQKQSIAILKENVTFKCFRELKTGFFDKDGNQIMIRKKSRQAFLFRETSNEYFLYLEHAHPNQIPGVKIAEKINYIIGQELKSKQMLCLTAVLACRNLEEINEQLTDEYGISEYNVLCDRIQPDMARSGPGRLVPMDIQHLLVPNINYLFRPGEIAVYKRPLEDVLCNLQDPGASVAEVQSHENHEEVGELIFVEIKERLPLASCEGQEEHRMLREYKIDIGTDQIITVSVILLYKFRRPNQPTETAIVPFAGNPEVDLPPQVNACLPEDVEEAQNQIRNSVRIAMTLPERERREAIRRLYRQWHPDRNMEHQVLANDAFKFLTAELEHNRIRASYTQQFRCWNEDIRRERAEESRYQKQYYRKHGSNQSRNRGSDESASFVPPSYSQEIPDPRSARLWYRQAEQDLQSAIADQQNGGNSPDWFAFKIQQTVEKALKAAKYSQNGKPNLRSNDLQILMRDVNGHSSINENQAEELDNAISRIIRMECDFNRTRYPERVSSRTSSETYVGFKAEEAIAETKRILKMVRDIIGIRVY